MWLTYFHLDVRHYGDGRRGNLIGAEIRTFGIDKWEFVLETCEYRQL